MKAVVVGFGTQGKKRAHFLGSQLVSIVDPIAKDVDYQNIKSVPLDKFDTAYVCTPEDVKFEIIEYLITNSKNVLVEKPFLINLEQKELLQRLVKKKSVTLYTAYNHRFEPHLVNVQKMIKEKKLGKIYSIKMFYGNGTARDVRNAKWRDQGEGVFTDLGPHLLDTYHFFFDQFRSDFQYLKRKKFENLAPDYSCVGSESDSPMILFETSLLSWRNQFFLEIIGEQGSLHVDCLCKWGPSTFIYRKRVLPSGRPIEEKEVIEMSDPTWKLEQEHFEKICGKEFQDLEKDYWISSVLDSLENKNKLGAK